MISDQDLIQKLLAGVKKLEAQDVKAYDETLDECSYYNLNTDTSCFIGCCVPHPDLLANGPASNPDVLEALGFTEKPDQHLIDSLNQLQEIHDSYWQPNTTFLAAMENIAVLTTFNQLFKEALVEQSNL